MKYPLPHRMILPGKALLLFSFFCVALLMNSGCQDDTKSNSPSNISKPNRPLEFESDNEFLSYVQQRHLNYMWDGAEPNSGLALERIHPNESVSEADQRTVTTGGSGFGIAGLIVGIDRGFIPRTEGVERLHKIADFLKKADRFHGVWPHWLYGDTGKVRPFSEKDNGADLVESAFLMQGLLCARQYFKDGNEHEQALAEKIDQLWREMEWSWFTKEGENVLYWHWSPTYHWEINMGLRGYDETLITYILAAASPTHPIDKETYQQGWCRNGDIKSTSSPYGYPLEVKHNGAEGAGGPLFWAHYSYFGFCPKGATDSNGINYWNVVRNHTLANYQYCVNNTKGYKGYGEDCWGLTASYSPNGYSAHAPNNDLGVITPTAALSSFPYTPEESMRALKNFYFDRGDQLWGKYGLYDAFNATTGWVSRRYLAIDQCTIAPMIENHRTGLLWRLFMSCDEIQIGLQKLGFTIQN